MYFKFTNQISQNGRQVAVWSVTAFVCCFFYLNKNSLIRDCFFLSSGCSNLSLLPIFLKLLPICTGGRSHFSLNLRASLVPAYYRDKFSFCKKRRIGLCGPQKFQMAPKKIGRGPNMALKITDLGTTLSLHGRMNYLPKFEAYIKRWDPQFQ